jgi:hypothetical protein
MGTQTAGVPDGERPRASAEGNPPKQGMDKTADGDPEIRRVPDHLSCGTERFIHAFSPEVS